MGEYEAEFSTVALINEEVQFGNFRAMVRAITSRVAWSSSTMSSENESRD
jgi:hypothetical protein